MDESPPPPEPRWLGARETGVPGVELVAARDWHPVAVPVDPVLGWTTDTDGGAW